MKRLLVLKSEHSQCDEVPGMMGVEEWVLTWIETFQIPGSRGEYLFGMLVT